MIQKSYYFCKLALVVILESKLLPLVDASCLTLGKAGHIIPEAMYPTLEDDTAGEEE